MANNYTLFSMAIKTVNAPEALAWANEVLTCARKSMDADEELPAHIASAFPNWDDDRQLSFNWDADEDSLFLYHDETGDPEQVAHFLQAYLIKFDPEGKIGFEYAATCSKPRTGEFGGGYVVVTATSIEGTDTASLLAKALEGPRTLAGRLDAGRGLTSPPELEHYNILGEWSWYVHTTDGERLPCINADHAANVLIREAEKYRRMMRPF